METALTTVSQQNGQLGQAIYDRVDPMDFIEKMGVVFARSGAGGCKTEADGKLMALACMSERRTVFDIARRYHFMNGKLVLKAETMLGDFRKAGGKHEWLKDGSDYREASLKLTDKAGNTVIASFTIEKAKAAGYIKPGSNWEKRPDQQLRARCITDGVRMIAPEVSAGEDTIEEMEDVFVASSAAKPAVQTRTPEEVKARAAEIASVGTTQAAGKNGAASAPTTVTAPKDESVIDAEFSVNKSTGDVAQQSVPLGDAAEPDQMPPHTQQAAVMEVELMVGQLGMTVEQVVQNINAGRAKKGESSISELGQLSESNLTALLGNLRKLIEKKLAAEGVPFATT